MDVWNEGIRVCIKEQQKEENREKRLRMACRTDTIEKLRAKRSDFEKVFRDAEQFKEMYKYTFTYAKNRDQKCMDTEVSDQ